jgi:1-acyl-sn-glycerol-3-phosphate acyltransferase
MTALVALLLAATVVLPLLGARAIPRACRLMLRVVGVRVVVRGEPGRSGRSAELLVANHVSWVDVVALSSVRPVRLLAKREVRDWPVVGPLAARAGAVFLDRARLRSLPGTVDAAAAVLRNGGTVAAFPEGTTWCGAAAGALRPAAFQAALDAGVPVRPVAVVLRGPDGRRVPEAAFVGEQTMVDTLVRGMRLPHVTCELTFLPALVPVGTRRELAARAAAAIGAVTGVTHPVRRAGTRVRHGPGALRPADYPGSPIHLNQDGQRDNTDQRNHLPRPCGNHADGARGGRGDGRGARPHGQRVVAALGRAPGSP